MPFYPSSAVGGTSQGGYTVSNLTSYQELKDIVIGNTVTLDYLSTANYPTDANIGNHWRTATGVAIGSSSVRDVELSLINFAAAGMALTAETTLMSSQQLAVSDDFAVNSFMNIQSKIEKVTYEMSRLAADLAKIRANTAGGAVTTPVSRYPSSQNRFIAGSI
jgi:hypothetical protein